MKRFCPLVVALYLARPLDFLDKICVLGFSYLMV